MRKHSSRRRQGFALLITLVVLALAAVILTLGARRTTTTTRAAMQAERDLKRKCALSAGDLFLAKANQFLIATQGGKHQPMPSVRFSLGLSGQRVDILLADEQAKPNLNTLAQRLTESDLTLLIERLGGNHAVATQDPDAPFWCLEQLRPGAMPAALLGAPWPDPIRPSLAGGATLWGNGKLHWQAASPAALAAVLGPEVPPDKAQVLVGVQQSSADAAALEAATSRWTSKEKAVLAARTTSKAQAWSAWVAVGGRQASDQPACYRLTVLTQEGEAARSTWRRQEWNPVP